MFNKAVMLYRSADLNFFYAIESYRNAVNICCPRLSVSHYYDTCSGLCVGSVFEEECSEMWYALWIVRFRESIEFWTHNVLSEYIWTCVCLSGDNVCVGNAGIEYVSVVYRQKSTDWQIMCTFMLLIAPDYKQRRVCISGCDAAVGWFELTCVCEHEIRLAHPPNLSILISEGKYTTLNAFSHCEWTRIKSLLEWMPCALNCCICMHCQFGSRCKLFAI